MPKSDPYGQNLPTNWFFFQFSEKTFLRFSAIIWKVPNPRSIQEFSLVPVNILVQLQTSFSGNRSFDGPKKGWHSVFVPPVGPMPCVTLCQPASGQPRDMYTHLMRLSLMKHLLKCWSLLFLLNLPRSYGRSVYTDSMFLPAEDLALF